MSVRIRPCAPTNAPMAELVDASASSTDASACRFDPCWGHQFAGVAHGDAAGLKTRLSFGFDSQRPHQILRRLAQRESKI